MPLPQPGPDRTAVVTGASSGIGVELARELARRGHGVTLVARSVDKLESLAAELRERGVRVEVLPADLSDETARAALPGKIHALGLEVHLLLNNAGLSTLGPIASSDPASELAMIAVDVAAVADLCSRLVPGMVARGRGAVLNVASVGAFQPVPGQAGYGACKAFVLSYTEALNAELRGTGVSASVLCPGPVDTGFGERAGFSKQDAEAALPSIMWLSAADVARQGIEGLAKGRVVTVPGAVNRLAARVSRLAPNRVLLPILAKQHPGLR